MTTRFPPPDREAVGTLLRHVLELLDGDVARYYVERGLPDYRPRFSPVVRALVAHGPLAIRDIGRAVGVTHSAASQTVAQMARADLVALAPDPADARHRIVGLTPKAEALLPVVEAEWAATVAAMRELDGELPTPLADLLAQIVTALDRRPFRDRIRAHERPPHDGPGRGARTGERTGGRTGRRPGHRRQTDRERSGDSSEV